MNNDLKWLLVSDVHFPRHDPRKVELFMKVAKWWQPHSIDLLGDIDDADSTSRWAEGTNRAIELVDPGVQGTRQFMEELTQTCKKAEDNHFHDGNHGWYRHKKYLEKNAPPFLGLINAETLYTPANYGFEFHNYDENPVRRFGDIFAHHGESISKHSGESVRNDCQSWQVSLVRGHSHRQGAYYCTYELTGQTLEGYEIGHLCDESQMDYMIAKNWQPGFAIAHIVREERIIDGESVFADKPFIQLIQIKETSEGWTCIVDGKKFVA